MADVVATGVLDIVAEFDNRQLNENVAEGMARARDEAGRFVKEHRTITQSMMADFGDILSTGTNSAISVMGRAMSAGADAAGKGFVSRISGALGALPGSIGTALSSGLISTATAAMRSAGNAASEAFAERVRTSAPYWKKSFTTAFTGAADPGVLALVNSATTKVSTLGDNFTRAGISAANQLGTALANAANIVVPALQPITKAVADMGGKLGTTLATAGQRGMTLLTSGIKSGATAIQPVISNLATKAASTLQTGMQRAGEAGSKALSVPFGPVLGRVLGVGLAAAVAVGGVKLVSGAAKIGFNAASGLTNAMVNGLGSLANAVASVVGGISNAVVSAAKAVGSGAAQAMGDTLKLGVNAVGTTVAGILGVSLTKGLGRLKAIDNAEASLRGLASTAKSVPQIMESVNRAVTGTAFGLDQGAKAAAQFAAAGVPISQMERHLGALANTAAAAGGDFDGVAGIFAKVAAGGKVTGDVLNQLTERGLAALPALADQLGVTAEEARKMVKEGEVSFDQFSRAMDAAMGATAIEQATTFDGLIGNLGASMGRFGAVLQRPYFEALKTVMPGIMNIFNQFKNVIEPLAAIIAERLAPAAEALGKSLESIKFAPTTAGADQLFGTLGALAPVIGGVAAAFAGPLLTSLPVVGSLFAGLTGPVGILIGVMTALFALNPETLAAGFGNLGVQIVSMLDQALLSAGDLIPKLAANFASNAPILISGFTSLIVSLVGAVAQLAPMIIPVAVNAILQLANSLIQSLPLLITAGIQLLLGLVDGIVQSIPVLIAAIPTIITSLLTAFTTALPQLLTAGVEIILALVMGIVQAIPQIITAITELLPMVITTLIGAIPMLIQAGMDLFLGLVLGIAQALPQIIEAVLGLLPVLLEQLLLMIPELIVGALNLFAGIAIGIIQALPQIISSLWQLLPKVISTLMGMIPQLIQGAFTLFGKIVDGIDKSGAAVRAAVGNLIQKGIDKLMSYVNGFRVAAGALIDGLIGGIRNGASAVLGAITDLASNAVDAFKSFLGINSPSRLFRSFGENVGEGLVMGINSMQGAVSDSFDSLIPTSLSPDIGLAPTFGGSSSRSGSDASASPSGPFGPGGASGGNYMVFDSKQPIEFVIVDQGGQIMHTIRTEIGKALQPTSRGNLRAYTGVSR